LKSEIEQVNRGNDALYKYTSLKLKDAYGDVKMSPQHVFLLGKLATNITDGSRAQSKLGYVYLIEGKQISRIAKPSKPTGMTLKEYVNSGNKKLERIDKHGNPVINKPLIKNM